MNNEFEQAFNFIIMHRYKTAYTNFYELYQNEKNNFSYLNGCIISLLLMGSTNELYSFLYKERNNSTHQPRLKFIIENIEKSVKPETNSFEHLSIFNLLISIIELMRRDRLADTDIYLRTALLLKPNDPLLYKYIAEKALKNGSIEKGCSYMVRAAGIYTKARLS